jgi:hypothetical protein
MRKLVFTAILTTMSANVAAAQTFARFSCPEPGQPADVAEESSSRQALCLQPQVSPFVALEPAAKPQKPFVTPGNLAKTFLREQAHIWLAPLRARQGEAMWLGPLAAGMIVSIKSDRQVSHEMSENQDYRDFSGKVSVFGNQYTSIAVPLGMYFAGRGFKNERMRRTGLLGVAAVAHTSAVVHTLKTITARQRPEDAAHRGLFWRSGDSFPSGHAANAWALATVISHEYGDKKWVRWLSYGGASAVSVSRVGHGRHFTSDVLIGSTLGMLIGRHLTRHADGDRRISLEPAATPGGVGIRLNITP